MTSTNNILLTTHTINCLLINSIHNILLIIHNQPLPCDFNTQIPTSHMHTQTYLVTLTHIPPAK